MATRLTQDNRVALILERMALARATLHLAALSAEYARTLKASEKAEVEALLRKINRDCFSILHRTNV